MLVQERCNSIAYAMELRHSYTNPSKCFVYLAYCVVWGWPSSVWYPFVFEVAIAIDFLLSSTGEFFALETGLGTLILFHEMVIVQYCTIVCICILFDWLCISCICTTLQFFMTFSCIKFCGFFYHVCHCKLFYNCCYAFQQTRER